MRGIACRGAVSELVVSRGDGTVDLEMAEHALDAIALAVEAFAVADRCGAIGFWRNDGFDHARLQVGSDRIRVVGLIGEKSIRRPLWKIDQRIVGFAVRRFAGREMEGDWAASGITDTMNFTGEPAPRAAKSSLMGPFSARCQDMSANRCAVDAVLPALRHRFGESDSVDRYEEALKELLKKKQHGERIEAPKTREPSKVINL